MLVKEKRFEMFDFVHNLEYRFLGLPIPDMTLFLYMPFQVAIKLRENREGKADDHESNIDHLRNAETAYLELAQKYAWVKILCAPEDTFQSLRSVKDIHEEVYRNVISLLKGEA